MKLPALTMIFSLIVFSFSFSPAALSAPHPETITSGDSVDSVETILTRLVGNASPVQLHAFKLIQKEQFGEGKAYLLEALEHTVETKEKIEILYLLALIERKESNWSPALKHLKMVEKTLKESGKPDLANQFEWHKRIGECYYDQRKLNNAVTHYKSALICANYLKTGDDATLEVLDSLAGCFIHEKKYKEAIEYLERLNSILAERIKTNDLYYLGSYFWTNLQISDCYRKLGNTEMAKKAEPLLLNMLGNFIQMRMKMEKEDPKRLAALREHILLDYLKRNQPDSISDCLCLAYDARYKIKSMPLIAWQDDSVPLKAAILCIHGMGLENRAFTPFSAQMTGKGYLVCALDVRGFGSWLASPGEEEMMFGDTIGDIGFVVKLLKMRHPGLPIFILGESMGGAIALRSVAELGDIVNGVIASVPSAERFQERKMAFEVAINFLKSPNRPYEILDQIASQATTRPELASLWTDDPKAKLKASPKEMIKFAIFMRQTEHACKKIKDTPVFLVQGLKDALVKPTGTARMLLNIPCSDKDMFIIGEAEHLIIESDKQNPLFIGTLLSWLDNHLEPKADTQE